jgi:hypothetical protein
MQPDPICLTVCSAIGTRIKRPGAGAHEQAIELSKPHGRIDATSFAHRTKARTVSKMCDDDATTRETRVDRPRGTCVLSEPEAGTSACWWSGKHGFESFVQFLVGLDDCCIRLDPFRRVGAIVRPFIMIPTAPSLRDHFPHHVAPIVCG